MLLHVDLNVGWTQLTCVCNLYYSYSLCRGKVRHCFHGLGGGGQAEGLCSVTGALVLSWCNNNHEFHCIMFHVITPCIYICIYTYFGEMRFPQDYSPKGLLLCRSWGACVPRRSQRLCQLEFWLLAGTTMLDRLWARGQTKCNTLLMLATSVFGRILLTTLLCDVLVKVQAGHLMAQWRGMHWSCLVPFVMLTPTILPGRVPSWLCWWLGV